MELLTLSRYGDRTGFVVGARGSITLENVFSTCLPKASCSRMRVPQRCASTTPLSLFSQAPLKRSKATGARTSGRTEPSKRDALSCCAYWGDPVVRLERAVLGCVIRTTHRQRRRCAVSSEAQRSRSDRKLGYERAMSASSYLRAIGIGIASGSRTFTGPLFTLRRLNSPWAGLVGTLSASEYVADKLPMTPSRLSPPALIARAAAGALSGRMLVRRAGGNATVGAALGAAASVGSAFGFHAARQRLSVARGWPDFPFALSEDAIALWLAKRATQ